MMLTPITTVRVTKQVQEQLASFITSQDLDVGDRLPSVQQLSDALGVSRPSLRESLRALEALGVIEIRHGSGIYVSSRVPPVTPIFSKFIEVRGKQAARDFLDLRLALEPEVAANAAIKASDIDLARLEKDVEDFRRELGEIPNPTSDMGFHLDLCKASHNNAFSTVMIWISRFYSTRAKPPKFKDVEDHQRIFEAVKRRDAEMARYEMTQHLTWIGKVMDRGPNEARRGRGKL
jgi:GntR family transcriptional repressor for pyruvate dehydrogenase complex